MVPFCHQYKRLVTFYTEYNDRLMDSYQSEAGQWNGREVNGAALSDVDKAGFQHSECTQHVNPPVSKANNE